MSAAWHERCTFTRPHELGDGCKNKGTHFVIQKGYYLDCTDKESLMCEQHAELYRKYGYEVHTPAGYVVYRLAKSEIAQ